MDWHHLSHLNVGQEGKVHCSPIANFTLVPKEVNLQQRAEAPVFENSVHRLPFKEMSYNLGVNIQNLNLPSNDFLCSNPFVLMCPWL